MAVAVAVVAAVAVVVVADVIRGMKGALCMAKKATRIIIRSNRTPCFFPWMVFSRTERERFAADTRLCPHWMVEPYLPVPNQFPIPIETSQTLFNGIALAQSALSYFLFLFLVFFFSFFCSIPFSCADGISPIYGY